MPNRIRTIRYKNRSYTLDDIAEKTGYSRDYVRLLLRRYTLAQVFGDAPREDTVTDLELEMREVSPLQSVPFKRWASALKQRA